MRPLSFIACASCALLVLLASPATARAETANSHLPREAASATVDDGSLLYNLSVDYDQSKGLYSIVLKITNLADQPVTFDYVSNERFDFVVLAGSEQLWRYNKYRFFVQQPLSEKLYYGQALKLKGLWDGKNNDGEPLAAGRFSLQALHLSSSHPFMVQIDRVPLLTGKWATTNSEYAGQEWSVVPPDHWAYAAMSYLIDIGALPGYYKDYFSGEHVLYRCDFAIAVARALDYAEQCPPSEQVSIMLETLRAEFSEQN